MEQDQPTSGSGPAKSGRFASGHSYAIINQPFPDYKDRPHFLKLSTDFEVIAMFQPVLTKLIPPQITPSLVQRADLLNQLSQGVTSARLLLVSAQAGAGKTTLLGQWVASC
jgi:hypothetical protein